MWGLLALVACHALGPFVLTCGVFHAGVVVAVFSYAVGYLGVSGWGVGALVLAACGLVNLRRRATIKDKAVREEGVLQCTEEEGFERLSLTREGFTMTGWVLRPKAGAENGETVLFIHGFPDNCHSFKQQMLAFADRGYTCLAPMLRGYEPNDNGFQPGKWKATSLLSVSDDMCAWLDLVDVPKAHVVGHDWGSEVAAVMARKSGDRMLSVVLMAVPDTHIFVKGSVRHPVQLLNSWYFLFFQWPLLPELWLLYGGGLRKLWSDWSSFFCERRFESVRTTLSQRGAISGAVAFYRGMTILLSKPAKKPLPIQCPALCVAGAEDHCLDARVLALQGKPDPLTYPHGMRLVSISGAGHFMHHEQPDQVTDTLLRFVSERKTQ